MDVNFWMLKERNSGEKKTMTALTIVDAASGMHIAEYQIQTPHTLGKPSRMNGVDGLERQKCLRVDLHRAQISKEFFDQAEGRGTFGGPRSC